MINIIQKIIIVIVFALIPFCAKADLYFSKPEDFKQKIEVAGIYMEHDGKFLMLHRQNYKPQGNRWGIPAGKVDPGEKPIEAAIRETEEETGIDPSNHPLSFVDKVYLKHPNGDFVFYMYKAELADHPHLVRVKFDEHKGFTWVTPEESLEMNLVQDQGTIIKHVYEINDKKNLLKGQKN